MESILLREEIGQCAMFSEVFAVKMGYDIDLRFIVEISKTHSVDSRRSSSTTGIFNVIDGGLRPREGLSYVAG